MRRIMNAGYRRTKAALTMLGGERICKLLKVNTALIGLEPLMYGKLRRCYYVIQ